MNYKKMFFLRAFMVVLLLVNFPFIGLGDEALEKRVDELEERVRNLEDYMANLQPRLVEFQEGLQEDFKGFRVELDNTLKGYSKNLQEDLNKTLRAFDRRVVELNPLSKEYQKVETSSGYFLIAIKEFKKIKDGFRMYVDIGNPSFASYSDVKIRLRWGKKWDPNYLITYEEWLKSLGGAEYTYHGTLESGAWTALELDMAPASTTTIAYVECEMEVSSVKLNLKKPPEL